MCLKGRQRPPRPPQVQRARVAVADGLLACASLVDGFEREGDLDEFLVQCVAIFMIAYYMLFGTFSVIALAVNLVLLISLLSMLQATLTLPGIAAMALAIGNGHTITVILSVLVQLKVLVTVR